jgi:hypothetical protein
MPKLHLFVLSLSVLAACGGGSDPMTYQQAVDLANQEEAQARMLGVNTPCQQTNQCGVLRFLERSICQTSTYRSIRPFRPAPQRRRPRLPKRSRSQNRRSRWRRRAAHVRQ